MEAVVVAIALLMWQWTKAGRLLVERLMSGGGLALKFPLLVLAVALGAAALSAMTYLLLPGSSLSQGWSREMLLGAQQFTALATILVGGAGLVQAHVLWRDEQPSAARLKVRQGK
ncbi:MAG: hypothetical protein K0S46_2319 [Moraxellaceae bacterium]|jgi:hypothetical protein|nr:hypothetical protein [Moraxellaceae bacterium]